LAVVAMTVYQMATMQMAMPSALKPQELRTLKSALKALGLVVARTAGVEEA
jgi:hypothetical protein